MDDGRAIDAVAERNTIEGNIATDGRQRSPRCVECRLGRRVQNIAKPSYRNPRLMKVLPELSQAQHRLGHAPGQHIEGNEFSNAHLTRDDEMSTEVKRQGRHQLADKLDRLAAPI